MNLFRDEPEHIMLELIGVKKGTKVAVSVSRRVIFGTVLEVTPRYLIIEENPNKRTVLVNRSRISWIEVVEGASEVEPEAQKVVDSKREEAD